MAANRRSSQTPILIKAVPVNARHAAWLFQVAAALTAAILYLWATRVPGIEEGVPLLLSVLFGAFVLSVWLYMFFAQRKAVEYGKGRKVLTPVLFSATLIIGWIGLPEQIAFKISENELVAIAEQISHNPTPGQLSSIERWAGVYYITECETVDGAAVLHLYGASSLSFRFGLGFFPDTSPKGIQGDWLEYEHYYGPWYVMKYYAL